MEHLQVVHGHLQDLGFLQLGGALWEWKAEAAAGDGWGELPSRPHQHSLPGFPPFPPTP